LRDHHGIGRDDIVLGVVAALRPEKAIGDLIAAAAYLRKQGFPVKVLVVGDGVELPRLRQEAINQQMQEHSTFLGALQDVRPALCAMDIFILPSVAVETFSNAALEAMAMGLPVVLSDIGGSREMISAGENGFVFQPGNILELSQTVEKIIRKDMIQAMGDASRRLVREHFALQTMVSGYQRIIDTSY
jgi:glycosyltransferase involved in cell wall biosynthesis